MKLSTLAKLSAAAVCVFLLAGKSFGQGNTEAPVKSVIVQAPNVLGMSGSRAEKVLEAAGLRWEYQLQGVPTNDPNKNGTIATQSVAAGQWITIQSTVVISTFLFVEPTPVSETTEPAAAPTSP